MMFGRGSKRAASSQAALAQLPDEALAARIAELRDADTRAAFAECQALVLEALARGTGTPVPAATAEAGVELCSGIALDDRQLDDPLLALRIAALLETAWTGGVHVITESDEQAVEEATWLAGVAPLLGFDVAVLAPGEDRTQRVERYRAAIVCGTTAEFAYDNLRNRLFASDDQRVEPPQFVAIVHDVTRVLLATGETPVFISAPQPVADDGWLRWAETAAAELRRDDEEVVYIGPTPIVPAAGVRRVLPDVDLDAVYADGVPLFSMLRAALAAQDRYRKGIDYELDGTAVVGETAVSQDILAAIAVRHGLPPGSRSTVLAQQTQRAHLRGYGVIAGTGAIGRAEAQLLRELYDLRTRKAGADTGLGPFSKPILRLVADLIERDHLDFLRICDTLTATDELVEHWEQEHVTAFPDQPDAFAERVASVERVTGEGGMAGVIRKVEVAVRQRLWSRHLVRMDTLEHELRQLPEHDKEKVLTQRADQLYKQLTEEYLSMVLYWIMNIEFADPPAPRS